MLDRVRCVCGEGTDDHRDCRLLPRRARAPRGTLHWMLLAASLCLTVPASDARAQADAKPLLQLEVGDSIGLPLPDAKLELFALLDGGIVWEWVAVTPNALPPGTDLIRISQPGYSPVVLSVPLQKGSRVALRVRLRAARDTTPAQRVPTVDPIHATGLAIQGHMRTDVIGVRRVLDRADLENAGETTLGALLRRANGTDLTMVPASGGSFRPVTSRTLGSKSPNPAAGRTATQCSLPVILNGDRRRVLPFEAADELVGVDDVEAIEIFPRGWPPPSAYSIPGDPWCGGVVVLWLRAPS